VRTVRQNKGVTLQNGWFVVQNRGLEGAPSLDREEAERVTLSKAPWADIPEQQRGTAKLKVFLANILCKRIRGAFPEMHKAIVKSLDAEKMLLHGLGHDRTDPADQREYIMSLLGSYQELAQYALKSPEELVSDKMKLRGMVRFATESFAEEMRRNGNFFEFLEIAERANGSDASFLPSKKHAVRPPLLKKSAAYSPSSFS
jgi:Dynamin central region